MTKRRRKFITSGIRVALCIVFVTLAVRGVLVHDRVTLKGGVPGEQDTRRVRLLSETESTITILDEDGRRETLPRERIAEDEEGEPLIERGLLTALRSSSPGILALAVAVFGPVLLMQALRFQLMFRAQEIHLSYWECFKISVGGNFLNFVFMIGSTAGDVFKAYSASLHTERKTEAVTTVLLDRVVGLSGLLVVAGVMPFLGSEDELLRRVGIVSWVLLAGFLVGAWMIISRRVQSLAPRRMLSRLPGIDQFRRIHGATERLIKHKPVLGACLFVSVVLQFVAVGAFVICAYALHMDFSGDKTWDYFAYIGAGQVVAAIPISVMGLGTMEFAYKQFFLGEYGTLPQLLCLALWVRLLMLFWAVPGAFVTLLGAYGPRRLAEVEDSLPAALEKEAQANSVRTDAATPDPSSAASSS